MRCQSNRHHNFFWKWVHVTSQFLLVSLIKWLKLTVCVARMLRDVRSVGCVNGHGTQQTWLHLRALARFACPGPVAQARFLSCDMCRVWTWTTTKQPNQKETERASRAQSWSCYIRFMWPWPRLHLAYGLSSVVFRRSPAWPRPV